MLYTLATSPFKCDFSTMVGFITAEDVVLLMQDGVVAAVAQSPYLVALQKTGAQLYALDVDINARGLQNTLSTAVSNHISRFCEANRSPKTTFCHIKALKVVYFLTPEPVSNKISRPRVSSCWRTGSKSVFTKQ